MKIIKFLRSIHYGNREFFGSEYNKLRKVKISEKSFNRYLVDWKKEGLIYSAGRGWYSDIPEEFVLYTEPNVDLFPGWLDFRLNYGINRRRTIFLKETFYMIINPAIIFRKMQLTFGKGGLF